MGMRMPKKLCRGISLQCFEPLLSHPLRVCLRFHSAQDPVTALIWGDVLGCHTGQKQKQKITAPSKLAPSCAGFARQSLLLCLKVWRFRSEISRGGEGGTIKRGPPSFSSLASASESSRHDTSGADLEAACLPCSSVRPGKSAASPIEPLLSFLTPLQDPLGFLTQFSVRRRQVTLLPPFLSEETFCACTAPADAPHS